MKHTLTISVTILFILAGCGGCKQSGNQNDEWITVDVTANYPKKELILQDFMDVEYIPLETNEEFVCQDLVLDITKNSILLRNRPGDGNIFIFDRSGKALRKINRKGQGAEEYTVYMRIIIDEERGEMFVLDRPVSRILVYDLDGNFKRSLKQDYIMNFSYMYNFDEGNLICRDYVERKGEQSFMILSKQDGSVTKEIRVPVKEQITMAIEFELDNELYNTIPNNYNPIIPYVDNRILTDQSSDTVYACQPGHTMRPVIARTPSVQSMNPTVFLFPSLFTGRYYFMDAVKKEDGFPATHLMYDKEKKAFARYTVYNGDYTGKTSVNIHNLTPVINPGIAACLSLQPADLIRDYENGKLKGRLKEIAAGLDEESNPVIMLVKHKK
ncbi:MAG: 6-bladed beta-propeller [Tannerellaceae bacterium]|jgi:hypothetical protein|nr:6-bladed beta-propeller [Tannerellaceae bacterium]